MSADECAVTPPSVVDYFETYRLAGVRPPQSGDWGLFTYPDGPAYSGAGGFGFAWFPDQATMYAFIRSYLVWTPAVLDGPNDNNMALGSEAAALFGDEALGSDEAKLRKALNYLFRNEFQIRWWGPLSNLLEDDGEFQSEFRESFWETYDEGDDEEAWQRPIPQENLPQFLDFVRHYGASAVLLAQHQRYRGINLR